MGIWSWKKGVAWVVEEEILHCVQNDKGGDWVLKKRLPNMGG
jgi:hypothetical protein